MSGDRKMRKERLRVRWKDKEYLGERGRGMGQGGALEVRQRARYTKAN